jgi:hypothetical protein
MLAAKSPDAVLSYFAIEARDPVSYTLAALRCGRNAIIENSQLANSNWQLAKATAFTTKDTKEHKGC